MHAKRLNVNVLCLLLCAAAVSAQGVPKAPKRLQTTITSESSAHLTWVDDSDDEDEFVIGLGPNSADLEEVSSVPADTTEADLEGLEVGNHHVRVKACNDVGCSKWSNTAIVHLGNGDGDDGEETGEGGGEGEEEGEGEGDCRDCDGQVTELTLRYNGDESPVQVLVTQRVGSRAAVVVFDEPVETGESFTFHGVNRMGTFGPAIKIWIDDVSVARFHTSCSEEIGPGIVSGDFEIVEGFSRNGGRLCAAGDDPDGEEPSCGECDGQVSSLTLRYLGEEGMPIVVRQGLRGERVLVFDGFVEAGEAFSFKGVNRQGTLGARIWVYVDGALDATFQTSCSEEIGPGAVQGDFEVVEGFSRNGGRLCAVSGN